METVKASAKLDKSILDGLKNARKSKNVELQDIATKALEIFLKDSAVLSPVPHASHPFSLDDSTQRTNALVKQASKARRGLKNAVKMVQVMARGPDL